MEKYAENINLNLNSDIEKEKQRISEATEMMREEMDRSMKQLSGILSETANDTPIKEFSGFLKPCEPDVSKKSGYVVVDDTESVKIVSPEQMEMMKRWFIDPLKIPSKSGNQFGKRIEFKEQVSGIVYLKTDCSLAYGVTNLQLDKWIMTADECKLIDWERLQESGSAKSSYRKIYFELLDKPTTGIIIGLTSRKEGAYTPFKQVAVDEFDNACLIVKKVYSCWIVATELNKTVLVDKKSEYRIYGSN